MTHTLLGSGRATVIGAPIGFNFIDCLRHASSMWIVTAFAHKSGWDLLDVNLCRSRLDLKVITGLEFCQTEPQLLELWLRSNIAARIYPSTRAFFHPKVFLVRSSEGDFSLIGSGNLSAGGLRDNVECFVYTSDATKLAALRAWFRGIWSRSDDFDADFIDHYRKEYRKAKKKLARVSRNQRRAESRITRPAPVPAQGQPISKSRRTFLARKYGEALQVVDACIGILKQVNPEIELWDPGRGEREVLTVNRLTQSPRFTLLHSKSVRISAIVEDPAKWSKVLERAGFWLQKKHAGDSRLRLRQVRLSDVQMKAKILQRFFEACLGRNP